MARSRPGTEDLIPADQPLYQRRELDLGGADQESSAPPKALPLTAPQALMARPSGPEREGFI